MALSGGLRDRMLVESITQKVVSELTTVGWFGSNRQHSPIIVETAYPENGEEPEVNTLVISLGSYLGGLNELGAKSEEHFTSIYIDFFGESRALSTELMGDIWEILKTNPVMPVYDYSAVGNPIDFYVELDEESMRLRYSNATREYQKFWAELFFGVTDYRYYG